MNVIKKQVAEVTTRRTLRKNLWMCWKLHHKVAALLSGLAKHWLLLNISPVFVFCVGVVFVELDLEVVELGPITPATGDER